MADRKTVELYTLFAHYSTLPPLELKEGDILLLQPEYKRELVLKADSNTVTVAKATCTDFFSTPPTYQFNIIDYLIKEFYDPFLGENIYAYLRTSYETFTKESRRDLFDKLNDAGLIGLSVKVVLHSRGREEVSG